MGKTFKKTMTGALMLCCAMSVSAADKPVIFLPSPGNEFQICGLSDNGAYAICQTAGDQEIDNPQPQGGQFLEVATRKITKITAPKGSAGVCDVADNGMVAGASGGVPATWDPSTGKWTEYPVPAGADGGSFLAVTPDGRYAVGYASRADDIFYASPILCDLTTGKYIDTPNLPTVDLSGENNRQNVFFGISPDGRYILAQMSQSYLMPVCLFSYIYDTQTHTWTPIGYDYDATTRKYTCTYPDLHFIDNQKMSCDGAWVTGTAYMVSNGGDLGGGSEYRAAYRYDIASNKLEVYTSMSDRDIAGNCITTDGVVLGCTPTGNPYPTAVIRSGKFFISLDQVLSQVYGMTLQSQIGDNVTGEFRCLSADGRTAVMGTYDNCYIIQMPESFADAASRVDLLSNYTVSIPSGSAIGKIGELKLTFDREISCKNMPSSVQLLKSDGSVVRNALTTAIAAANSHQMVLTFRTTPLDPGEKYTVRIPAEYIWLSDDASMKSKEINLTYTGRAATPVKVVRVTPADGSVLSSLDPSSAYITLRFDADVKASGNGSCMLYNADDNTLVAALNGSVSGKDVYIYPDGECKLYYGSNYRVEIGAGVVTDLSGSGENEAMTLHYKGSYIRQLSDDDIYPFNSDCNDYDKFIYWQNEFNQPGAIPASWGFTAENPWLLVRDSDNDTDQALAAHSMFDKPGTSDDWLIVPQLFIPDGKATLTFDAQSFLSGKQDRLKVYVYEDDMVYNYFSTALTEKVIEQGNLIFDEVLSPGASDELLAGDWTRYSLPLEQFAGKNVYIAFVNRNTDQSAIFIDNVQVTRDLDFLITNSTPELVVAAEQVKVQGIVTSPAANIDYLGVDLKLLDASGTLIDEIVDATAVVSAEKPYRFQFTNALPLVIGEVNSYTIDATLGDKNTRMQYTIKDLAFKPARKVVLEEYSGSACGNCPQGFVAAEHLASLYPENFIPVILRTYSGDVYSQNVTGYSGFIGLEKVGAPSARVNRGEPLFPMVSDGASYKLYGRGIMQSDGTEAYLWSDAVQDEMAVPAELSVDLSASYNSETRTLTVPVTVRYAVNAVDRSVNLFAVVTEDNLVTPQSNYMSTVADPILGEWGVGGAYAKTTVFPYFISDVARCTLTGNAYNGVPMSVSTFTAGESYTETLTATLPDKALTDASNCSVVVMAIDGNTGRVLNANKTKFGTSGIAAVDAGATVTAAGSAVTVTAPGAVSAEAYTTAGVLLAGATGDSRLTLDMGAHRGLCIVRVTTADGASTYKLIIK